MTAFALSRTARAAACFTSGTQGLSLLLPALPIRAVLRPVFDGPTEKVGMRGPFRESELVETPPCMLILPTHLG